MLIMIMWNSSLESLACKIRTIIMWEIRFINDYVVDKHACNHLRGWLQLKSFDLLVVIGVI